MIGFITELLAAENFRSAVLEPTCRIAFAHARGTVGLHARRRPTTAEMTFAILTIIIGLAFAVRAVAGLPSRCRR